MNKGFLTVSKNSQYIEVNIHKYIEVIPGNLCDPCYHGEFQQCLDPQAIKKGRSLAFGVKIYHFEQLKIPRYCEQCAMISSGFQFECYSFFRALVFLPVLGFKYLVLYLRIPKCPARSSVENIQMRIRTKNESTTMNLTQRFWICVLTDIVLKIGLDERDALTYSYDDETMTYELGLI